MSNITEILHSIPIDEQTGSISVPVYQTTTFVQQALESIRALTYECEAKFYISYQGNEFETLQFLFESIEEKFESRERNYVIGNIKLKKLKDSQFLNQANYSIIQID